MFARFCGALVIAGLFAARPATAQGTGAVSDAEAKQAAVEVSKAWDDAYNAGNTSVIAGLFAGTGVYLTPGGTMIKDHGAMQTALAARLNAGWTHETIKVMEAHSVGNQVWAIVEYTIAGSGRNAGKQIGGYAAELLIRDRSDWRLELVAANLTPARDLIQDVTGMASATMVCPGPC